MALLDELLVGLGYEYDPADMKRFKDDVRKTTDLVKGLTKAAVTSAAAITGMVVASTRASDSQGKLAGEIGDSVENVDALSFALQIAGGSSDAMAGSLQNLAIRSAEAARGVGSGVEAFGLLGISVTDANGELKSTSDLMLEISEEFQGLDRAKQIELADKLGLRDSIRLLQLGPNEIAKLTAEAKELGVVTEEDAAISAEFQDSLTKLWRIVKQVSRSLTKELAPILQGLADSTIDWWKANKDIIQQKLPEWIDAITKGIKLLTVATGIWLGMRLASNIISLISLMKGLSVSTMLVNAAVMAIPALIAAAITAIALLAEDAKVFFEGGESFIGDMIKKYPEWTKELQTVAAIFATIADLTSMIWEGWKGIIDIFSNFSLEGLKEFGSNLPGFLGEITGISRLDGTGLLPTATNAITNAANTTVDKIEIVVQGAGDTAENVANEVYRLFEQTAQELQSVVDF